MAIGDLSTTTGPTFGRSVVRVVGQLLDDGSALETQVAEGRIFGIDGRRAKNGKPGVWRRLWTRLRGSPSVELETLTALMNAAPDVQVTGVEEGVEWLEIPFSHLVFFSALSEPHLREAIETHVRETLEQEWRDYVDPLLGFRVAVALGRDVGRDKIVGFFGRGVFVPRPAERPIGRIEIAMVEFDAVDEPKLTQETAAGLYRGQSALALAENERIAPATSEYLPADVRFLLRGAGPGEHWRTALVLTHERIGETTAAHVEVTANATPTPGFDATFRVEVAGGSPIEIRVIEDVRLSRLWAKPPQTPLCFQIAGIVAPTKREDFEADRWWIDLDCDMNLVSSAMRPRFATLVCERGGLYLFDWTRTGPKLTRRPPFNLIQDVPTFEGSAIVVEKSAGGFGYLRPPRRRAQIRFEPAMGAALSADSTYDLDWLDFAGAVETPLLVAERLGEYSGKAGRRGVTLPGLDGAPDPKPSFLARPSSDGVFEPVWRGEWRPGVELIAGPLLLRIVEGGADL